MIQVDDFTAILSDDVWRDGFGTLRRVLTYGFAEEVLDHQRGVDTPAFEASFRALNGAERAVARQALQTWEDASAIAFLEVPAAEADLVFGTYDFSVSPTPAPTFSNSAARALPSASGFSFAPGPTGMSTSA